MRKITYKPTKYRIDSNTLGYLGDYYFLTLKKLGYNIYREDDTSEYARCFIEVDSLDRLFEDISEHFNVSVTMKYADEPNEFEMTENERKTLTQGTATIHLVKVDSNEPIILEGDCTMTIEYNE